MRILVVEDEHKIANAIKRGLEQESMAVDVAYDADDGFSSALVNEYDAIILDRMLPGTFEGIEICRRLRERQIHTPILILTAKDQLNDKVSGLNAGADDYLVKPFAFEELLARLRALMRRPANHIGVTLKVGELTLDPTTKEVKKSGKLINLSSKEFALLEYLMRHPNRVLSKDQIIAHVWDYDADVLPNTVEVYVGYIRNKIDKNSGQKLIKTLRGFGYKIEP
jgi:DNA-binding response OmpR family regulator